MWERAAGSSNQTNSQTSVSATYQAIAIVRICAKRRGPHGATLQKEIT